MSTFTALVQFESVYFTVVIILFIPLLWKFNSTYVFQYSSFNGVVAEGYNVMFIQFCIRSVMNTTEVSTTEVYLTGITVVVVEFSENLYQLQNQRKM